MTMLLTITACFGLLSAGFVLGDYLTRRRAEDDLRRSRTDLTEALAKIQAVHNQQVITLGELTDRLGGVEMLVKGVKR